MLLSNSATIRTCAAGLLLSHGKATGLLYAPLLMRRESSVSARRCQQFAQNACALKPSSCLPISRGARPHPPRRARSSNAILISSNHFRSMKPIWMCGKQDELSHGNPRRENDPRANPRGTATDRFGGCRPKQIPCKDCIRLAQAGRTLRHSAPRSTGSSSSPSGGSHSWGRSGHGEPHESSRYCYSW